MALVNVSKRTVNEPSGLTGLDIASPAQDPLAPTALKASPVATAAIRNTGHNPGRSVAEAFAKIEAAHMGQIAQHKDKATKMSGDLRAISQLLAELQQLDTEKSSHTLSPKVQELFGKVTGRGIDLFVDGKLDKLSKGQLAALKERLRDASEESKTLLNELMTTHITNKVEYLKRTADIVKRMLELQERLHRTILSFMSGR